MVFGDSGMTPMGPGTRYAVRLHLQQHKQISVRLQQVANALIYIYVYKMLGVGP